MKQPLERIEEIRIQARCVLELTKGFTPEQRKFLGNYLTTMEDMADYILEIIQILDLEPLED